MPTRPQPAAARTAAQPISSALAAEIDDPMRRMALYFSIGFIFLRFSHLHEMLTYTLGFNTYILYIVGLPAMGLSVLGGAVRRVFSSRLAWMWTGLVLWMALSVPFSFWKGESIALLVKYARTEIPCLFLIGGLCMTWADVRKFLYAIMLAGALNVVFFRQFLTDEGGRMFLEYGTIANANDLAAHLILIVPFLLLGVLWPKRNIVIRATLAALIVYAIYMVLGTGSRGALVALLAAGLYAVAKGPLTVRLAGLLMTPIVAVVLAAFLPTVTKERLLSVFSDQQGMTGEAIESRSKRTYLLMQSLKLTAENPLFGVGMGQFMNYEGFQARESGGRGAWQVSHNSYTQVSSELGLPGMFFFLAAITGTYVVLARNRRQVRGQPGAEEIELTIFCTALSLVGFCVAIFFLTLAYRFYLPTMSGLVIAIATVIRNFTPAQQQTATPLRAAMPPTALTAKGA
jgi:O-antigen ligase